MKKSVRFAALPLAAAALAVVAAAVASNKSLLAPRAAAQQDRSTEGMRRRFEQRRRLHAMPEIVSETPSLRVVHAEIKSHGPDDYVLLTLRNESPKPMLSFTICSHIDENGYTAMSIGSPSEDIEALAPYAEKVVEVIAGNVEPGRPLTLCAVMFADETQEGVETVTHSHKQSREKAKRRRPNP